MKLLSKKQIDQNFKDIEIMTGEWDNKEIKVYVINADMCDGFRGWELKKQYNKIMDKAEELGSVYSLQGFQEAVNNEELNLENSFIYFSNI